jgi:hypothetical protein
MLLRLEEVEERLADLRGCHHENRADSLIQSGGARRVGSFWR